MPQPTVYVVYEPDAAYPNAVEVNNITMHTSELIALREATLSGLRVARWSAGQTLAEAIETTRTEPRATRGRKPAVDASSEVPAVLQPKGEILLTTGEVTDTLPVEAIVEGEPNAIGEYASVAAIEPEPPVDASAAGEPVIVAQRYPGDVGEVAVNPATKGRTRPARKSS